MKPAARALRALCAAALALPSCGAAWLFLTTGFPVLAAGAVGFAISVLGCKALFGRISGLIRVSFAAAAVFGLIGLQLGYVDLIMRENAAYGCTFGEALSILPQVLTSPVNRADVLSDHLQFGLGLAVMLALSVIPLLRERNGA